MKIFSYILSLTFITCLFSCKKDNYTPPASQLSGALTYKGDSIGVEYDRVPFQLYQYGFGKVGAIDGTFDQNGSYHALLFDGDYKFIIPGGQGPFLWKQTASGDPDSLSITMKGNQNLNIEVMPFYMIRNAKISANGTNVTATFKIEQIITGADAKDIENVTLFINNTQFVSGTNNIGKASLNGTDITDPDNVSLAVAVPSMTPAQNYVFARVGLKISGVEDLLFSPLQKIPL